MAATRSYDTVQQLRDEQAPTFDTAGAYSVIANGLTYKWVPTSTQADNGKEYLRPTSHPAGLPANQGAYEAQTSGESAEVLTALKANTSPVDFNGQGLTNTSVAIDVRAFGAKGDGITDDTSAFQAAITAAATTGRRLFVGVGTWLISTLIIPAGVTTAIESCVGAVWTANVAGSLATNAMIVIADPTVVGSTTTLSATPTVGSNSLTLTSGTNVAIGVWLRVDNVGLKGSEWFKVIGWNPGTKVANVDREVLRAFASGDTVSVLASAPGMLKFYGKGCTATGSAVGWFYLNGIHCELEGVTYAHCAGTHIDYFAIDTIGFDNEIRNCNGDAYDAPAAFNCGFGLITSTGGRIVSCYVANGVNATAFKVTDGFKWKIIGCQSNNCEWGSALGSDLGAVQGDIVCDGEWIACSFNMNSQHGLHFAYGCSRNTATAVEANDNTLDGAHFYCLTGDSTKAANDNRLIGCQFRRNVRDGIGVEAGALRNSATNCHVEASGRHDVNTAEAFSFIGGRIISTSTVLNAHPFYVTASATGHVVLDGTHFDVTTGGGGNFSIIADGGTLRLSRISMAIGTNVIAICANGGKVFVSDTQISIKAGATGTIGLYYNGSTLITGPNVDLTQVATAILAGGGAIRFHQQPDHTTSSAGGDANYTYTAAEWANRTIEDTSTITAGRDRVLPNIKGMQYTVMNNGSGAFSMTFKVTGQTGVAVAKGKNAIIRCNGTDYIRVTADT